MNNEQLLTAQKCQLEIIQEIDRVCKKNNIDYYLAYGSMIGAVRHHGFIPWDDDLDIAMLRKNYDRFIQACNNDLSEDFFLQTYETDPNYGWPFAKLLKKGTVYKELWAPKKTMNGVFVDIFPIDKAQQEGKGAKIDHLMYRFFLRILHIKLGYKGFLESGLKRVVYGFLRLVSVFYTQKYLKDKLKKILLKYDDTDSEYVHNLNSPYSEDKERMPLQWFDEVIYVKFENTTLPILKNYDAYLKHIYGNYMKLPPQSERENRHKIQEFKV